MIPVTRPFIPDRHRLNHYLDRAFDNGWLSNNGPLVRELTTRLEDYLEVSNLLLVANGTIALQIAFRVLGLQGEAVTSPFTFVATASALKWQGIVPRFADIDAHTLTLDPARVETAIGQNTSALVPVHVYGNACHHKALEDIARQHDLRLIYDASHTFGARRDGQSLLMLGDAATLSLHATKLFHTVEGGAIRFHDPAHLELARQTINFGQSSVPEGSLATLGINGKMSEVHAAFGLANLDCIDQIVQRRLTLSRHYRRQLSQYLEFPVAEDSDNGAYCPLLFPDKQTTSRVLEALSASGFEARRYFSPALHETTEFRDDSHCPVASDRSRRVLCLPLYPDLDPADIGKICNIIKATLD